MAHIRVLVVDDSALIRQMLSRALSMDPRVQVVGVAKTGVEAIEKAVSLNPDVITLDVEMPELTGLEALPHLRKRTSARVVMLSSLDDPDTTYRALNLGAVDFIPKPTAGMATSITELTEVLLKKIKTAYRITPEQAGAATAVVESDGVEPPAPARTSVDGALKAVVALTASTGGPPALERVFSGLPASMPAAFIVVQHLPRGFSKSFARRLDNVSEIPVAEAVDGETVVPGRGYVIPHGAHGIVEHEGKEPVIRLVPGPAQHGVVPAADPLFVSVANEFGPRAIAVILTGMGSDGARGALAIRERGGETIVQDERTSVVFGMPSAAQRMGAAGRVVGLGLVAAEIRRQVRALAEGAIA